MVSWFCSINAVEVCWNGFWFCSEWIYVCTSLSGFSGRLAPRAQHTYRQALSPFFIPWLLNPYRLDK